MKIFSLLFLCSLFLYSSQNRYVNIISNIEDTSIYMDEVLVGKAPLYAYELQSDKTYNLRAQSSRFYTIEKMKITASLKKNIETININLLPIYSNIEFLGENGTLYIDGKQVTFLNDSNRIQRVKSAQDLKIEIINENRVFKDTITLEPNSNIVLKYELKYHNVEANLNTVIQDSLMWQDNSESKSKTITYEDALLYCKDMELASFTDWRLPSLKELKELKTIEDKLYFGVSTVPYWTSDKYDNESTSATWKYAYTYDFAKDKTTKKVEDYFKGSIRCVRDIALPKE